MINLLPTPSFSFPDSRGVYAPPTSGGGFNLGEILSFGTPQKKASNPLDLSNAISGAGQGAATGAVVSGGNPIGAAIGAGVGIIDGLFGSGSKPASGSSRGGLTDALKLGLGSIFPSKGSGPNVTTQTQSVDQNTGVNITNVLGGRSFGNVDDQGNFDTFQALADVFAIKDAMNAAGKTVLPTYSTPPAVLESKKFDFKPLLLAGGALLGIYLLTKGGK